ncbi:hypothetical protein BCU68_07045 [Vibrio sp. 10N.286.49.B3]|uniref:phosphatase PAP2 family protein n=1 Tax=Vibrio sp. 10N.286.49.B3 TaxID=1880855 RepID=UPI000C8601C6|nr:phosphatase PAP2 family protein [Vibrio sp. 10N.286.49.B3]PMH39846.1 hypothetical protein BCU68_07045 [Vibrio sp. 10N.286.49.B3]
MRTIEPIVRWDVAFSLFCLQHRFSRQIAQLSKAVSHTGDGHLYAIFALCVFFFDGEVGQQFLIVGLAAFAIELPIYWIMKNGIKRRRPPEFSGLFTSYITPSDQYSLPSGHTAAAFVMATLIATYYPAIFAVSLVWAICIGLSRIQLGVHFLSDVLLGAVLGVASASFALMMIG